MRFVKSQAPFPAYIGGIGSGKSFAGAAKVLTRIDRKGIGMICAPTYPMLRDSTLRTMLEMLDTLGVPHTHLKSDNIITILDSGHEILCRSLDNPDGLRGPNLEYAWIDEGCYVSRDAGNIVKGRVRVGPLPQTWLTSTPKGRNWVWEDWERDSTGNESDPTHPLYRVRTQENPELPAGYAEGLRYSGVFAAQELGGEFVAFEGLVYSAFSRPRHVAAEADRCQPDVIYMDPSAKGYIMELARNGYPVKAANNDVIVGIGRVTDVLEHGFTIDPSCINTIAEFESYRYPEGSRSETDKPIKESDHALDAFRYFCLGDAVGQPEVMVW